MGSTCGTFLKLNNKSETLKENMIIEIGETEI